MEAKKNNMENNKDASTHSDKVSSSTNFPEKLATRGVFFQCPMIHCLEILPQEEWPLKIEKFIEEQIKDDPVLQSILLIKNCNHSKSKVEECIKFLVLYIEHIIQNKDKGKYYKIKMMDNTFIEKVLPIKGAIQLLQHIGFIEKKLTHKDHEENFLVFSLDSLKRSTTLALLQTTVNDLQSKERIQLVLDRNCQVLLPSQVSEQVLLPPEFFIKSDAFVKMDNQKKNEKLESDMNNQTQNLHVNEYNNSKSNYKYCLIRVRFPDNFILQGTFDVNERLSNLFDFVKESIFDEEQPFKLSLFNGHSFDHNKDKNMTLSELNLVPIVTLKFVYNSPKKDQKQPYLKCELFAK